MEWLSLLFLFALSILLIWKPEWVWKFDNFLSTKGGEPSDFYLAVSRISGVCFLACSLLFAAWLLSQMLI